MLDADDRALLILWGIRGGAALSAAVILGLMVRLFLWAAGIGW